MPLWFTQCAIFKAAWHGACSIECMPRCVDCKQALVGPDFPVPCGVNPPRRRPSHALRLRAWLTMSQQKAVQRMHISYKRTRHPQTQQFEQAAWIDFGRCGYVTFPDGLVHEKPCVWEVQEEAIVSEEQRLLTESLLA